MAKFLTREEIYRLLAREAPENVYPDGAPSAYFSTADQDSVADVAATAYVNLSRIEANNFITTAEERIDDWVTKTYEKAFDPSLSLETKRQRVIDKLRKRPTITLWEILKIVVSYLPEGKYAQVFEYCGTDKAWKLGVSLLGIDTFLKPEAVSDLNPPVDVSDWCDFVQNPAKIGWRLSDGQLGVDTYLAYPYLSILAIQANAYAYEIRIFDYTMPDSDFESMLTEVQQAEPARSGRFVRQNLNLSDFGLIFTVNDVDQFSGVTCITRDSSSSTGFTGKTT